MEIKGNAFIVTGGASGLGGAVSRRIVAAGGHLVIADIQVEQGEALAQELGPRAHALKCDVTSETDGAAAVTAALSFGALRGLVNCAGIAIGEKMISKEGPHPLAIFSRVISINLIGTFNMIRLCADAMSRQLAIAEGERGVVINTASVAAFDGQIGQAAYSASKGGIVGMTLPIARDLARNGIRCMTIAPGLFLTPMVLGMPQEVQDSLGKQAPFPSRLGKPEEFAALAQHIIENVMLNGEVIRLDGAIRMAPK
jgi:NAD(P)-dependent dehydrogenase (short-subunit alcohol dehydrogenase family)